eukprot:529632-Lingulodinium_polyedra.AAC.1
MLWNAPPRMLGGDGPKTPPRHVDVAKAIVRICRRDGHLPAKRRHASPQSSHGWYEFHEVARAIGVMLRFSCPTEWLM